MAKSKKAKKSKKATRRNTVRVTFDTINLEQAKSLLLWIATNFSESPDVKGPFFASAAERKRQQALSLASVVDLFTKGTEFYKTNA